MLTTTAASVKLIDSFSAAEHAVSPPTVVPAAPMADPAQAPSARPCVIAKAKTGSATSPVMARSRFISKAESIRACRRWRWLSRAFLVARLSAHDSSHAASGEASTDLRVEPTFDPTQRPLHLLLPFPVLHITSIKIVFDRTHPSFETGEAIARLLVKR